MTAEETRPEAEAEQEANPLMVKSVIGDQKFIIEQLEHW
jgi:hypothetical protein